MFHLGGQELHHLRRGFIPVLTVPSLVAFLYIKGECFIPISSILNKILLKNESILEFKVKKCFLYVY